MPNRPDDLVVSVEPRNDGAASAKADRAASLRPQPASPFSRSGIPSADKSGIYDYAHNVGKALIGVAPKDFKMGWSGDEAMTMSFTLRTTQEAEAVREIIRHLCGRWLKSHRDMLHGDIHYVPAVKKETFSDKLKAMFGTAQGTSGSAQDAKRLDPQGAGPVAESDAPDTNPHHKDTSHDTD